MKFSFPRVSQWVGVAAILFVVVGLNYDFESDAGETVNAPVENRLSQGLLGYWKMDEGTGTSTTADASGNANNLTMSNMESGDWVAGQIGAYALDFDGAAGSGGISYLGYSEVADSDGNQSQSVTVPANTDFALAFISGWRSGTQPTVTSISLGGTAMTSVGSSVSDTDGAAYMYYVNTSSGSKTFASVQSNSWTEGGKAVLLYFSGVHQSAPIRSSSALNNSNNATLSFTGMTSSLGDLAVLQMQGYSSTNVDVDLSSQTKIFENTSAFNSEYNAAAYKTATGSTIDLSCYGNYPNSVVAVLIPATAPSLSEYLSVADPASGVLDIVDGADFSIVGWFNRDTENTLDTVVAKRNGDAAGDTGYLVWLGTDDFLNFEVSDGTDQYAVASSGTYATAGWHHFAAVWNDTTGMYLYIDGALSNSTVTSTSSIGTLANAVPFRIGAESDDGNLFDGKIDDIKLYAKALSEDAVKRLYQTTVPGSPVDTGLVGHWTFDGNDVNWGDTGLEIKDVSGKGNHGAVSGLTRSSVRSGKLGQGLSFDGTGDYVSTGSMDEISGESMVSLAIWIKSNLSITASLLSKYQAGNEAMDLSIYPSNSILFSPFDSSASATASGVHEGNIWEHWTIVFDGTQTGNSNRVKMYKNGISQTLSFSGTIPATTRSINNDLKIGSSSDGDYEYAGLLDDVRIYNRALSATEVVSLYNMGK